MTPIDGALDAAARGWFVFPVREGGKEALVKWRDQSSNDPAQIETWAQRYENCNWGVDCGKSGLFVLDIDPGGADTLFEWELEHGELPPTRRHSTPRGGEHIFFVGPGPTSAGRLGKGIDTRGEGGYVLLPGSIVGGKRYAVVCDLPHAPPPATALQKLGEGREREKTETAEGKGSPADDTEEAIARASHYLDAQPGVRPGERGSTAYRHAAQLRDFGLSFERALALLEGWNDRCEPSQAHEDLHASVAHAYKYAQNESGSKAGKPLSEMFAAVAQAVLPQGDQAQPGPGTLHHVPNRPWRILDEAAQDALQEPKWIIKGHIPENSLGAIIGTPESYKSFIASDLALGIAAAVPWLGSIPIDQQGAAIFCAGEGAINMARRRRPAWREARGIKDPIPFICFDAVPLVYSEQVSWFIEDVLALNTLPRIIVFDTLARMMGGLDENNAKDMGIAIEQADRVRRETGASVIFVAHTGKDASKGLRGSSAGMAAFDWAVAAEATHETRTVKLSCAKMKDAEHFRTIHAQGRPFGASLVFSAITQSEHAAVNGGREQLPLHMVVDALKSLGFGEHSTRVLADTINAMLQISMDDERERRTTTDLLNAGAKDKFKAFAVKNGARRGAPFVWRLPAD